MPKQMSEKELNKIANNIRKDIIDMLVEAKSGHSAGSLGMVDVFTALYFGGIVKYDPKKRIGQREIWLFFLMLIFVQFGTRL